MKSFPSLRLFAALGALAFACSAPVGRAYLLDWDTLTWNPGFLSQTYNIGPGTVDVTISGPNTADLIAGTPLIGPPNFDGGTGENALQIFQKFTVGQNINVTVTFTGYGPMGVAVDPFMIFDVDKTTQLSTSVDQVGGMTATLVDSSVVAPSSIVGSVANSVLGGTATGISAAADLTSQGNVTVTYSGTNPGISQFVFNYAAAVGTGFISPNEGIALGDINFTPVPEAGTVAACAVAGLLGAWGLRRLRAGRTEA
jgi:hypothetical protein